MLNTISVSFDPCDVVNLFKAKNYAIYEKMTKVSHDYSTDTFSTAHAEGSIWSHTCSVLSNLYNGNRQNISLELFLAGLLHDVGKTETAGEKELKINNSDGSPKMKRTFIGHQNYGSLLVYDILKNMYKDFINVINVQRVIELVNLHMFFNLDIGTVYRENWYLSPKEEAYLNRTFSKNKGLFYELINLCKADSLGRFTRKSEYAVTISKHRRLKNLAHFFKSYRKSYTTPSVTMFIGLPGSGKTTYRNSLSGDFEIVSMDDILVEKAKALGITYNEFIQNRPEEVSAIVNSLDDKIRFAGKENKNIVIDMTDLHLKSRRRKLSFVPKNYYRKAIVFIRSLEKIREVNREREKINKFLSDSDLDHMLRSFTVPTYNEFDEIQYLFIEN